MWTSALARPIITTPLPMWSHASRLLSHSSSELHARLAVLGELEHADEVVERGAFVAVRQARVDVGQAALDRGVAAGVVDGRHESLLLTGEHRRVSRVVGTNPVGSQLTQRIEVVVHPSLPIVAVEFADSHSRSIQARANRAHRDVERGRDLVVAELLPHEQQQRVALAFGELGHRLGDAWPEVGGVERGVDAIAGVSMRCALGAETRGGLHPARFAPAMLGDEVGGDPVEPRDAHSGRSPSYVDALLERDAEHLAEQRVGFVGTDAPDEVAEQHARVTVEQRAEDLGLGERRRDDRSIGLRIHHR